MCAIVVISICIRQSALGRGEEGGVPVGQGAADGGHGAATSCAAGGDEAATAGGAAVAAGAPAGQSHPGASRAPWRVGEQEGMAGSGPWASQVFEHARSLPQRLCVWMQLPGRDAL